MHYNLKGNTCIRVSCADYRIKCNKLLCYTLRLLLILNVITRKHTCSLGENRNSVPMQFQGFLHYLYDVCMELFFFSGGVGGARENKITLAEVL
jgi:hypothetical protein